MERQAVLGERSGLRIWREPTLPCGFESRPLRNGIRLSVPIKMGAKPFVKILTVGLAF